MGKNQKYILKEIREEKFEKKLAKCSRCKYPIVEGDDHLYYKEQEFSFIYCHCDTSHPISYEKKSAHFPEEVLLEQDNYVQRKLDHYDEE